MTRTRLWAAVAAAATLAACSNEDNDSIALLRQLPAALLGGDAEPPALTPEALAGFLASSPAPVSAVALTRNGSQTALREIERNGPYATFATSGRQSVTFREGMVTATRGLGGDLMSSDADGLLALVQSGHPGSAPYTQRYLTPEDVTRTIDFTCAVSQPPAPRTIAIGPISAAGSAVVADCSTDGLQVTNVFLLGPDGAIAGTEQWLGPTQGMVRTLAVRR